MIKTKILFAVLALFAVFSTVAEAKLYKWVDSKGETHYGEVIPPEYADRERVQIEKGHEVKPTEKPKAGTPTSAAKTPEEFEQERRDQALLGTFSSEAEIDLARDRNLQQVNARINSIQERLKTARDDLAGYQKEKDGMIKAGKPVDRFVQDQIEQATAKQGKLNEDLKTSQAEAKAIQNRYDADKKRYHELTAPPPAKQ